MSINVPPMHPLAEILARKLFSIQNVPKQEQAKMVNRAIKAATLWAMEKEKEMESLKKRLGQTETLEPFGVSKKDF